MLGGGTAAFEKIEIEVGAGKGERVPHNPLLAGLVHEEAPDALSSLDVYSPHALSDLSAFQDTPVQVIAGRQNYILHGVFMLVS